MRRMMFCVLLLIGCSVHVLADNPHVLNPYGCVDDLEPMQTDTCPVLEQVSCPSGPCTGGMFIAGMGCVVEDGPNVWEEVTPGPGGSFENYPSVEFGYGNGVHDVDFKLCYTKQFCWCKRDENGDKVCITSTLKRDWVIRKWEILPNVICHITPFIDP